MARPTANLRLFAAIYPSQQTANAMIQAISSLDLPPHRLTPQEQIHMTVQFIGDTPSSELDAVIESVRRATAGLRVFPLTPIRLITLPERGPARLAAVECESHPTLMEIHRRLVMRLTRNARGRNDERFRPHLTLCRFKSPARGVKIDQQVSIAAFTVDRIALMRSTLSSAGAVHHEVARNELE